MEESLRSQPFADKPLDLENLVCILDDFSGVGPVLGLVARGQTPIGIRDRGFLREISALKMSGWDFAERVDFGRFRARGTYEAYA